jgi:hypothetical protein
LTKNIISQEHGNRFTTLLTALPKYDMTYGQWPYTDMEPKRYIIKPKDIFVMPKTKETVISKKQKKTCINL